ncbi:hypothetical protein CMUS01_02333 [Colletotrichum musicola]|uniref:Uncharacterized protein n=1 Tax=Colletotrichum musicola TaxID=2175873 RepID=A0A8H6NV67_9PEZI|nr:hypothetical protein CMUS01_02333 [Colletotrichum musicola]
MNHWRLDATQYDTSSIRCFVGCAGRTKIPTLKSSIEPPSAAFSLSTPTFRPCRPPATLPPSSISRGEDRVLHTAIPVPLRLRLTLALGRSLPKHKKWQRPDVKLPKIGNNTPKCGSMQLTAVMTDPIMAPRLFPGTDLRDCMTAVLGTHPIGSSGLEAPVPPTSSCLLTTQPTIAHGEPSNVHGTWVFRLLVLSRLPS